MAKLYVLTGPAGVGKSTITKSLAEKIGKCAVIEGDEIYHQVVGAQKPWLEGNHLEVMWKNILDLSQNYLEADIDVIINYIIYKDNLLKILKTLAKHEVHFVLIMANRETIIARDEGRDEDVQVHRVDKHLEKFNSQGYDQKFVLNTENKTIEQEVDEILTGKFLIQAQVEKSHCSGLQKLYFDKVSSGEKVYELRLNDEKRQGISVGDDIVFSLEPGRFVHTRKKVLNKLIFKDFSEACEKLDTKKVGFESKNEMKIVYNTIYSKEEQQKYGVVAFELGDAYGN